MVSFQIGKGKKLFEISPEPYGGKKVTFCHTPLDVPRLKHENHKKIEVLSKNCFITLA